MMTLYLLVLGLFFSCFEDINTITFFFVFIPKLFYNNSSFNIITNIAKYVIGTIFILYENQILSIRHFNRRIA